MSIDLQILLVILNFNWKLFGVCSLDPNILLIQTITHHKLVVSIASVKIQTNKIKHQQMK